MKIRISLEKNQGGECFGPIRAQANRRSEHGIPSWEISILCDFGAHATPTSDLGLAINFLKRKILNQN